MLQDILIGFALAMDCFAVSVVCAVVQKQARRGTLLRLAFLFGFFQSLMPLLGWLLTSRFQELLHAFDHWIAFAMLALIGGKMVADSFKKDEESSLHVESWKTQVLLAIATSIDALAVGISYACSGYADLASLARPLVIIGAVSFLMSVAGYVLGARFGRAVNRVMHPELLGGVILIGIGVKILLTHLGGEPVEQPAVEPQRDLIEERLQQMTLREKVGQLFCVRPEAFDVALKWDTYEKLAAYALQEVTPQMEKVNAEYPVGGIILFAHNIQDEAQLDTMVRHLKAFDGAPLLYIDEEGGRVARIANNPNFKLEKFPSMTAVARSGDPADAYRCGHVIGTYLKRYGFDVDLAPVADVNTNPANPVIGTRAFSSDPTVAGKMVVQYLKGLEDAGLQGCVKHFPGHGDTKTDTHFGYAQSLKSWAEMLDCEMVPFREAIAAGVPLVMTAHVAAPKVTGDNRPATLSPVMLQDKLRGELGFQGVIITDGMAMGAITRQYNPGEAALLSLQAGADIILGPKDFRQAFDAVLDAVQVDSTLTEARIDESVRRVLQLKARIRP